MIVFRAFDPLILCYTTGVTFVYRFSFRLVFAWLFVYYVVRDYNGNCFRVFITL